MFQENSIKIITVDPNQAKDFLELNTFPSQRRLNPRHVKKLEKEITEGTFRIGEIATAVEQFNGNKKVLMNGQHQLHAIINTGKKIKAVYEIYDVFTPTDLSLLFRKFDNNAIRTLSQKALVEARALDVNWSSRIISLVISSIQYKTKAIQLTDSSIDSFKNYLKVGDFINSILTASEPMPKHMMRGPVGHAMMLTYEKSQGDSLIFWSKVRDGEGLNKSDPAKTLRDFLMSTSVGYGRGASDIKLASIHEMTSKCITSWNAFRKGTKTDLKYYSMKPIPKAL